jgi:hypothetical protein
MDGDIGYPAPQRKCGGWLRNKDKSMNRDRDRDLKTSNRDDTVPERSRLYCSCLQRYIESQYTYNGVCVFFILYCGDMFSFFIPQLNYIRESCVCVDIQDTKHKQFKPGVSQSATQSITNIDNNIQPTILTCTNGPQTKYYTIRNAPDESIFFATKTTRQRI